MKFILAITLILGGLALSVRVGELLNVADITCEVERTLIGYPVRSCSIKFNDKGFVGKLLD